ncbi:hypothetical protein FB451DRAFT_1208857 [Mycena latifolia]|nr:hypothetical protein FB451DRAFT_1208857 [Mycena latifolia]
MFLTSRKLSLLNATRWPDSPFLIPLSSTETYEDLRLKTLNIADISFDVRNPKITLITHCLVKRPNAKEWPGVTDKYVVKRVQKLATERELAAVVVKSRSFRCLTFELWAPPASISEADWYSDKGYKGIVTVGGAVLTKCYGIYDSMFGHGNVETWKIPESSTKKGFTVADYHDLYVGRYKKRKDWRVPTEDLFHVLERWRQERGHLLRR